MFFESITKILNKTFNISEFDNFDNVDPGLVKYFRTEYGQDWKVALTSPI